MSKLLLALILSLSGVTISVAYFGPPSFFGDAGRHHSSGGNGGSALAAPEIDPSSAISALTMLLGGVTVLRSRMSRKK
jgi:hypothetical protein